MMMVMMLMRMRMASRWIEVSGASGCESHGFDLREVG